MSSPCVIFNTCPCSLHSHFCKSKEITVMKVNKWNQIKQGHTSLEGQQMGTGMEVILCFLQKGKKAIRALVKKASCYFAWSAANCVNKKIGLRGTSNDRGGSLILTQKDGSFVKKRWTLTICSRVKNGLNNLNLVHILIPSFVCAFGGICKCF